MRNCDLKRSLGSDDIFLLAVNTVNIISIDITVLDAFFIILDFQSNNGMFKRQYIIISIEFLNVGMEVTKIVIVVLGFGQPTK